MRIRCGTVYYTLVEKLSYTGVHLRGPPSCNYANKFRREVSAGVETNGNGRVQDFRGNVTVTMWLTGLAGARTHKKIIGIRCRDKIS
jgi:hypothetical protein